jgi:hypothetical protein
MNHTNEIIHGLDVHQFNTELRDASRMAYGSAEGLPKTLQYRKHELGRGEVRTHHYMGAYPYDAPLLVQLGACPFKVLAPARLVEREVWFAHRTQVERISAPCLNSAQLIETERQGHADEAQLRLAAKVTLITLEDAERSLWAHEVAIRELRSVIAWHRSQHQRQAAA